MTEEKGKPNLGDIEPDRKNAESESQTFFTDEPEEGLQLHSEINKKGYWEKKKVFRGMRPKWVESDKE